LLEIDKAPFDIDRNQLGVNPVADIQAVESMIQFPFHRHMEEPHPGAFIRSTRDNGLKLFVDTFDGAKPRFLNRGKKRRSVLTLSIPRASARGVKWVDSRFKKKRGDGHKMRLKHPISSASRDRHRITEISPS